MKNHKYLSSRNKIGILIQDNKLFIIIEIIIVASFPICLAILNYPRTIIPLFLMGWLSLFLRKKNWKEVGLCSPSNWFLVMLIGIGSAMIGVFLEKIISPLLFRIVDESQSQTNNQFIIHGNVGYYLLVLCAIWLLGAIGEELVYRGYVLNRLTDLFGQSKLGWIIGILLSSIIFSLGHGIFNWANIIGVFLVGLFESILYLTNKRNLWFSILFHGSWDTILIILFILGFSRS